MGPAFNEVLIAYLACVLVWTGLVVSGLFGKWPGRRFALAVLQFDVLVLLFGLSFNPFTAITTALFPPLSIFLLSGIVVYSAFLLPIVVLAAIVSGLVLVAVLRTDRLKPFWVLAAGAVFGGIVLLSGEAVSQAAMCNTAKEMGVTQISRHPFFWSFSTAAARPLFEIHGLARKDGESLGWSYKEMNWYVIPQGKDFKASGVWITCN